MHGKQYCQYFNIATQLSLLVVNPPTHYRYYNDKRGNMSMDGVPKWYLLKIFLTRSIGGDNAYHVSQDFIHSGKVQGNALTSIFHSGKVQGNALTSIFHPES